MHPCIGLFQYVLIFCTCYFIVNLKKESNNSYKITSVQLSPILDDKIETLPTSCLAFNSEKKEYQVLDCSLYEISMKTFYPGSQLLSINELLQSLGLGYKQRFQVVFGSDFPEA